MKFLSIASAIFLGCSSVLAHPILDAPALEERQSGVVITSGAGGSTVYPRLEIRQMKNTRPNQYTLLVLALEQWKATAQSTTTGYWGISSIHGVPRQNYNNVPQCSTCTDADGYCPHDSILFPAWHRVYVALFEQEFLKIALNIANSYPASQKQTMVNAANQMRWPYWDWAAHPASGLPTLPRIVTDYSVTVNAPSGQRTLNNPLFRYDFTQQEMSSMYYGPFVNWPKTYRYPSANDGSSASNTQSCINAFESARQSLQDQVYSLFTQCKDYSHFSNDDAGSSSTQCSNSLEGIHNTVHTTAGGGPSNGVSGGHMFYLPTASYDPLFWLHHANVDRIFAMWQRLNPNSYGGSQTAPHNTWTIKSGTNQDQNSALTPFYKDSSNNFWTTAQVQDWTIFKYTYPEFSNSDGSAASITNYVNKMYGPNANAVAGSSKRDLVGGGVSSVTEAVSEAIPGAVAQNGSTYQYVANIQTNRYALNGSYQIFLFNGNPTSEEPSSWITDKNLIGPMGVLAQEGMAHANLIAAGSVPLTTTLNKVLGDGILADLAEALVVPFLTANLQWRIQGPKGECVDPGTVPDFVVSIYGSTATQICNTNELPVFSEFIPLLDVTKGRSGGLNATLSSY